MAVMAGVTMLAIGAERSSSVAVYAQDKLGSHLSLIIMRKLYIKSILRITGNHQLPMTKTVTIARNKSMLIELPRELRDVSGLQS